MTPAGPGRAGSADPAADLADFAAGAHRHPVVLWELTARVRLLSDTHIGSADDSARTAADIAPIDRDPLDHAPRLRASTQAGLLRHHLAARLGPDRADAVAELFGEAARGADPADPGGTAVNAASALDIDDAFAELPPEAGIAVRAGNRVDPGSGAAAPGAFWRMETLPAGTRFTLTLRLWVADPADEGRLLALAALAADGLNGADLAPGVAIGARTARGYGAVRCDSWHLRRHDLRTPQGWADWYALTWRQRRERAHRAVTAPARPRPARAPGLLTLVPDHLQRDPALAAAIGGDYSAALADLATDRRHRDELTLTLRLAERPTEAFLPTGSGAPPRAPGPRPGLLMVGDTPRLESLGEVDRAHLRRPSVGGDGAVEWRPALGDTALFALFKRLSRRLVRDISGESATTLAEWPEDSPARRLHARWWGGDARSGGAPAPSGIRLRQAAELTGGTTQRTTRVTIDSLFGDAVDSTLLTDDVHAGGQATVILDAPQPDDAVRGLLALIVRELHTVPLDAIGGGSGAGHGRVTVTRAVLTRHEPGAAPDRVDLLAAIDDARSPERAAVGPWVSALRAAVSGDRAAAPGPNGSAR